MAFTSRNGARRRRGAGAFEYLRPLYALPAGMSFNANTGYVDGTVMVTTYAPPATVVTLTDTGVRGTISTPGTNAYNLNQAITTAAAGGSGTRIRVPAGADFGGRYTLPVNNSTGWVYIETTTVQSGTFVPEGTRALPADVGLMPKMYQTVSNGVLSCVFDFAAGASKYRFVGLDFTFAPDLTVTGVASGTNNNNVGMLFHTGSTTLGSYVSNIVVDRCVIRGQPDKNFKRGMWIEGSNIALLDSSFQHMLMQFETDGQCFTCTSGPGPYKLNNNHMPIGNRGECFIFGGGTAYFVTSDIEMQRNHFEHPVSYHGTYEVKNLVEFKIGKRVLLQANVLNGYNSTGFGNQFYPFVVKTVDQSNGGAPLSQVRDVTALHNEWRNCSSFAAMTPRPENNGTAMRYVDFINNRMLRPSSDYSASTKQGGVLIGVGDGLGDTTTALLDVRLRNNTIFWDRADYLWFLVFTGVGAGSPPPYYKAVNHQYVDNLLIADGVADPYSVFVGDPGGSTGMTLWNGIADTSTVWSGNCFTKTVALPAGSRTTATIPEADLNNTTFELNAGSPFKNFGASGRDPGPVHALINAAINGVV